VDSKALVDTLDKKLTETDANTHGDTLGDVETFAVFDTFSDTLAERVDEKVKRLVDTLYNNLPEAKAERQ